MNEQRSRLFVERVPFTVAASDLRLQSMSTHKNALEGSGSGLCLVLGTQS